MMSRSDNVALTNNRPKRSLKNTDLPGGLAISTPRVVKKFLATTLTSEERLTVVMERKPPLAVTLATSTSTRATDRIACALTAGTTATAAATTGRVTKTSCSGRRIHDGDNRAVVLLAAAAAAAAAARRCRRSC